MSEIVQYLIFNKDLKMSKGKCVAQGCHVTKQIVRNLQNDVILGLQDAEPQLHLEEYLKWINGSMTTITLQADQWYLEHLISLNDSRIYHIRDEGRTQIEPNSLTCVGLIPMTREEAQPFVGGLKLL